MELNVAAIAAISSIIVAAITAYFSQRKTKATLAASMQAEVFTQAQALLNEYQDERSVFKDEIKGLAAEVALTKKCAASLRFRVRTLEAEREAMIERIRLLEKENVQLRDRLSRYEKSNGL